MHEALANALPAVVVVHIAGVLVSSVLHRENLVRSMLTGYKSGGLGDAIRCRHRVIGAALLAAVAVFWIAGPDSGPSSWSPSAQAEAARSHSGDRRHDRSAGVRVQSLHADL